MRMIRGQSVMFQHQLPKSVRSFSDSAIASRVAGLVCSPVWTMKARLRVCVTQEASPGEDPEHSIARSTPSPSVSWATSSSSSPVVGSTTWPMSREAASAERFLLGSEMITEEAPDGARRTSPTGCRWDRHR